MRPVIIEAPQKQTRAQRWTSVSLTLLAWWIWVYLWWPAITLILWLAGVRLARFRFLEEPGYRALFKDLSLYGTIAGGLCAMLILWALLNWYRFGGQERRKAVPRASLEEQARAFDVEPDQLRLWRRAQVVVVSFNGDGSIAKTDVNHPSSTMLEEARRERETLEETT